MATLLGIDIGTTSLAAVLYCTRTHRVLAKQSLPHDGYVEGLKAGRREQSPKAVLECLDEVLESLGRDLPSGLCPDGICVTGHVHGFVFLDEQGDPIGNFITWEDLRASEQSPSGRAWIDEFIDIYTAVTPQIERTTLGPGYAAVSLYVLSRQNDLPGGKFSICSVQDWIISTITGCGRKPPVTDRSCAHSTGLYLPNTDRWHAELLTAIGIDESHMPEIKEAGSPAGVTVAWSSLPPGIPIYTGLGDNQASFLGSVLDVDKTVLTNVGTGSQMSLWSPMYRKVPGLDTRPFFDGSFLLVGAPLCGGRAFAHIMEFLRSIGTDVFSKILPEDELYSRLIECAEYETDLVCRTTFSGTRIKPDERGSIRNISLENFTVGDLSAAVLHGIAQELYEAYDSAGDRRSRLVGSGNGIRRNPVLRTCISDRFALDLSIPPYDEEAAVGAALVAGIGCGAFPDFRGVADEIRHLWV